MKTKIFITTVLLLAATLSQAQNNSGNATKLPKKATDFIASYFNSAKITNVKRDYDDRRTTYEVNLSNGTEIDFREDGSWKEVNGNQNAIPTEFIQKNISRYISEKYPDAKLKKIEQQNKGYELELTNSLELSFSTDGKFLKLDD